jgi:hypothetical protein
MRLVLKAALAAASFCLLAGSAQAAGKPKALFESDEPISLTLSGPMDGGMSRLRTAKPVPGVLKVAGAAPETLSVTLSVRGVTRRLREICSFPPLYVTFVNKPPATSIFKGQKRLKLVTHCQDSDRYQQYVLLEYASYRLYRALTPESFGVRLARINYLQDNGKPITTRTGFFIEDVDAVAKRNGQQRLKGVNHILVAQLDPAAAARFAVFQYMISNLDWSMTSSAPGEDCCHNSRLLSTKGATTGLVTVPYDFDYGGLVNAPYAVPPSNIHRGSVRVRYYRGFCQHNEQAQAVAADISARRTSLLGMVDQTPGLDEDSRKRAASYLGEFFDQAATPQAFAQVLKTCPG